MHFLEFLGILSRYVHVFIRVNNTAWYKTENFGKLNKGFLGEFMQTYLTLP